MKNRLANLLITLLLGSALAACDAPAVEVSFAEPYPAGGTDIKAFLARHQGQYVEVGDTATTLLVTPQLLLTRRFWQLALSARQLDSLGFSPGEADGRGRDGRLYMVQPLAADSFRLRWAELDTLATLAGPHATRLRRYRGRYYLNTPAKTPAQWLLTRIGIENGHLQWQTFNPDSLRVRALAAGTVQQARAAGTLHLTLRPTRGRPTRQVSRYAGLWLPLGEYRRRAPKPAS